MRKIKPQLLGLAIIAAGIAVVLLPHIAFAEAAGVPKIGNALTWAIGSLFDISLQTFNKMLMWFGGYALTLSSQVLLISGTILNSVLNTTMHMSRLVNDVTYITVAWRTIRDFSSMFFIFILLFSSFQIIFGVSSASTKRLILNIIICGLFVNFSLFFTKVIVDASNVVSLGFYSAIMPQNATLADGGISNIFAQQLRLVTQWDPRGLKNAAKANFEAKVGPALWLGSAVMIIAAGSFFVVSLIFIIRIALLILLMAFSPIYFISLILPNAGGYGKKWLDLLISQSFVLPIYLAMIYIVLSIVSSSEFSKVIMGGDTSIQSFSSAFIDNGSTGVIINYIIIIVLLNLALTTAMKGGGMSADFANKGIKLLKQWGPTVTGASLVGRNTVGRLGSWADGKLADTHAGNSKVGRWARSFTTGGAATYKWGGNKSFEDTKKKQKEINAKQTEINNKKQLLTAAAISDHDKVRASLKNFNNKTITDFDKNILTNPIIAAQLNQSQLDEIMKSDKSQEDKTKISQARQKGLENILGSPGGVTALLAGRKPEEIAKLPPSILKEKAVSLELDGNILAKIARDGILDAADRQTIRDNFDNHFNNQQGPNLPSSKLQKAYDWLNGGQGTSIF